ncbi:MAG: hypothetical protein NT001_02870 [Candidatus Woesearchaeota archaeon]|nr:hypothetical protein [Candidatus Woesearchaeota archaeon]
MPDEMTQAQRELTGLIAEYSQPVKKPTTNPIEEKNPTYKAVNGF